MPDDLSEREQLLRALSRMDQVTAAADHVTSRRDSGAITPEAAEAELWKLARDLIRVGLEIGFVPDFGAVPPASND
jgi:hypothetical protein